MKIFFYRILCISILFRGYSVYCQTANAFFERITPKEGLSQSAINYIIQDKKGFMWFATYGGLIKYDGYTFKVYRNIVGDRNSLSNNGLIALYEDRDGCIWVTNNAKSGFDKFDPVTESFTRFSYDPKDSTSISSNDIYHVAQDKSGNIWVCANNALNLVVNEKRGDMSFTRFKRFYNASNLPYAKSYEDRNGKLLLFADYLYFFDRKTNRVVKSIKLQDSYKNSVSEDKSGNLWLGANYGLSKLTYNKQTQNYESCNLNKVNVTPQNQNYLVIDDKDRIWIATQTKGLFQYDIKADRLENFLNDKTNITSISDNSINCLDIDRSGILWIGTYSQGLCKVDLNKKAFFYYNSIVGDTKSLSGNAVSSIHSTKPGELWVALDAGGGINRFIFDHDKVQQVIHYKNNTHDNNTIPSNTIFCLVQRKNGEVWAGGIDGFVTKIIPEKPGSNKHPVIKAYKLVQWTFSIYEDRHGTLWGGTWLGGLWRYDDRTAKFISYMNNPGNPLSLCDNVIWTITEDNSENIWIGGHSGGLSILTAKEKSKLSPEFINLKHQEEKPNSLSNNTINVIFQDHVGTIWIGTGSGLNRVIIKDNNFKDINSNSQIEFHAYHIKDGLPSENIVGILEDDKDNLWLSTSNGLSKFNINKDSFTNYEESDGLQSNEFSHNAYFRDQNRKMYFGGFKGLNAFYPDSIKPNPFLPNIVFTDIKLFNKTVQIGEKINGDIIISKSINYTSEIILSHKNNAFTIEFAALHYVQPNRNSYAYKLSGFDKEWNHVGNKRDATYTNLDPGEYIFSVIASNNDGVWNKKGASIKIIVLPPWWMTWWFRIITFLFIISSSVSFYLVRVNSLKKQKQLLEQAVKERTLEIEEKSKILYIQKAELYDTNVLLEEKQQEIEEQNETLLDQSQKLNETNTIMEERQMQIEEQAEELLASNEQLIIANTTKDKFFSIIAHDIKSPFSSILGLIGLLYKRYDTMNDLRRKEIFESMNESGKNLYKLLDNLLLWANSQTRKIQFEPKELNLNEIIDENILLLENLLIEKKLEIQQKIDSQIMIFGDRNMIDTVIRNLINNAIKFTKTGYIRIEAFQDKEKTKVSIIDTGVGIEPTNLNKIFDIMGSKSALGTNGEKGTGIGLLLCKEFIEKHGGSISAISEPGKGSVFCFTVPLKNADK